MQNEMTEKVKELLSNEEYVKNLLSLDSAEAMSKELEKEGVDLSPDEIRKIGELLRKKENGELTDEELEEVTGGVGVIALVAEIIVCAIAVGGVGFFVGLVVTKAKGCY